MSNVVNTLCELGYVRNDELKAELSQKSTRDLITDFILPRVVEVGGQDTRGWRLSPSFMELMTRHAQDFISADNELGNLLFELAMQRIQRHPNLKAIDYIGILPKEYQKYSAAWDQPGLWGDEEWEFIKLRLLDGLKLSNQKYREHCKALLLQIAKEVLPMISPCHCGWFGLGMKANVSNETLSNWTVKAVGALEMPEVIAYLLKEEKWRSYKKFLSKCVWEYDVDWDVLFAHIDLDKEKYYRGISRWGLKACGLYDKKTKECIKKEILCA